MKILLLANCRRCWSQKCVLQVREKLEVQQRISLHFVSYMNMQNLTEYFDFALISLTPFSGDKHMGLQVKYNQSQTNIVMKQSELV